MAAKTLLLLSGLAISGAFGKAIDHREQTFLPKNKLTPPNTISVQSEASVTRNAELGTVQMNFFQQGTDEDETLSSTQAQLDTTIAILEELSEFSDTTWSLSNATAYKRYFQGHFTQGTDFDILGNPQSNVVHSASADLVAKFLSAEAYALFYSRLPDPAWVSWVDWKLSDASQEAAFSELREQAVQKAHDAGETYARLFDAPVRMIEYEEGFLPSPYDVNGWHSRRDDGSPHELKLTLTTTAKFAFV